MRSTNITYIPALDQLRGYAALLIVFYHGLHTISYKLLYNEAFKPDNWPKSNWVFDAAVFEGHTAVAMFMVLSGFIFTIGSFEKKINYKNFIRNRFLRTYPLFLVILILGMIAAPQNITVSALMKTIFFMSNASGAFHSGAFTAMFWTVAIEWQFYLVFPLLLWLAKIKKGTLLILLIGLFVILRALMVANGSSPRDLSYWTIWGRMDEFLFGMISGIIYIKVHQKSVFYDLLAILFLITINIYLYALNIYGGWPSDDGWKILTPTIEGFLWGGFILGFLSFAERIPKYIGIVFCQIGKISYSVYLLHFIVLAYVIKWNWFIHISESNVYLNALATTVLVVLPITLCVSAVSYKIIEEPFLKKRSLYTKA